MKKILVSMLIAVMVGATLTGCGNKNGGNTPATEQGEQQSFQFLQKKLWKN